MGEKPEPKWIGPFTIVEVKESGGYIIWTKIPKVLNI